MLFIHKPIKIIAHMIVRNEDDIIQSTIEHNIEKGISGFIITNNGSTDKTRQILSKIPEVLKIYDEPSVLNDHSAIMTKMAREAAEYNPDWVLNIDSDEFWNGIDALKKETNEVLEVFKLYHHFTIQDNDSFNVNNFPYYLDCGLTRPNPRIIHKPSKNIIINHGNHGVSNYKGEITPIDKIHINHYCIRSLNQFKKKTEKCKRVIDFIGNEWGELHDIHFNHWKLWSQCVNREKHFKLMVDATKQILEMNKKQDESFYSFILDKMIHLYGVLPQEAKRIVKTKQVNIKEH